MRTHSVVRRAAKCTCLLYILAAASARAETGPLVHEDVIAAPVERVWDAFTTGKGLESWMVAHAEFDLRVGGKMRTNYNQDGVLGDKDTIENTILSFEPQRMLSIKATRAPEGFPYKQALENMWTVVSFEPLAPDRTRVRCTSMGFTDSEDSQKMRQHFDRGNAYTLRKLREHFTPATSQPAGDALVLAQQMVGGEWDHQSRRDDGHSFHVRQVCTPGADGKSLMFQVWIDEGQGSFCHGHTQVWREPGGHRILFQNIDEKGSVARGELRATSANRLEWDWNAQALDGTTTIYRVNSVFDGRDRYTMELSLLQDKQWKQLFSLPFERKTAPASRPSP